MEGAQPAVAEFKKTTELQCILCEQEPARLCRNCAQETGRTDRQEREARRLGGGVNVCGIRQRCAARLGSEGERHGAWAMQLSCMMAQMESAMTRAPASDDWIPS